MRVKLLNHGTGIFEVQGNDRKKFFNDVSKGGIVADPVEVYKTHIFQVENKSEDTEDIVKVPFVLSTYSLDRDNERIEQSGWDVNNFLKNPVLLWQHDRWRPSIGLVENLSIGDSLKGTVVFAPKKIDHFSWSIGQKVHLGMLRAGSVSFRPLEWKWVDDASEEADLIFLKQELAEFSIVNIPANPEALSELSENRDDLKELVDSLESMMKSTGERVTQLEEFLNSKAVSINEPLDKFLSTSKSAGV